MINNTLTFDDDLDVLAPNAAGNNPTQPTTQASAPALEADSVSWGDEEVGRIGDGLNRLKPEANKKIRIALVPGIKPRAGRVHWIEAGTTKGNFRCSGTGCPLCLGGNAARYSVAALAVQYTTADPTTGKLPKDAPLAYQIGYLSLGQQTFRTVSEIAPEGSTPADVDILITYDGRRYDYKAACSPPRYRQAGDEEKVKTLAAPELGKLGSKVGRTATAQQMKVFAAATGMKKAAVTVDDFGSTVGA